MFLNYLLAFGSLSTLLTAQFQIGANSQSIGQLSQIPNHFQRRSSNTDAYKDKKFVRPFAFRRPIVVRRPIMAVAPNYNTGPGQVPARPVQPVFVRRPYRPFRPIRPFGIRPMVARPLMNSARRPVYMEQSTIPVRPLQAPLARPLPQLTPNSGRLPNIELRTQEKRNFKQELEEIKKPLLKILNSGAKIAIQKVLQRASEKKNSSQKIKNSKLGLDDVISGAEVVLRHYLDSKNANNKTELTPQKRADSTTVSSVSESLFSGASLDSQSKKVDTLTTTNRPNLSTTKNQRRSDLSSTSKAPIRSSTKPTVEPSSLNVRSTILPSLLAPWQTSNLLNLIKNSPLYNSIQSSVSKTSSQVNWKAANVSLVNAKIFNDTKGRRMGYIPSAWYSEDSDEIARKSTSKIRLTTLEPTAAIGVTRHSSQPDADEAGSSESATSPSSEEMPISAEEPSIATKSQSVDSSSEEVSQQRLLVVGKGSANPVLYSSSDETRSEEVPLWVLTTRKPTHSFGFGHSVVINNHRAPSQNGVKRRRTTTTRKPTTTTTITTTATGSSGPEPIMLATTTPSTSNSRFPLEVFDTAAFNTTIVHQNIITIAKPTRPFIAHPTQTFTTRQTTTKMTTAKKKMMTSTTTTTTTIAPPTPTPTPRTLTEGTTGSQVSSDVSVQQWDESDENFFNNQVPEESHLAPSRIRAPSSTTPMPVSISATASNSNSVNHNSKRKPTKKAGNSPLDNSAIMISTSKPWLANPEAQFANKPINQVPALLSPLGSLIQLFPNSLFRILQTIGGLVFALPTLLTFGFMAAMMMV